MRIVSLVPSQTELLYHLGLTDEVVAITKFCIRTDEWFKSKTRIGGTKTVDIEKVRQLKPSLILANKEENVKEQVEALQQIASVYVSDITTLQDALQMIKDVGALVNKEEKATALITEVESGFNELSKAVSINNSRPRAAYLIWRNPYMAAGGDTFINDMMDNCGLTNLFQEVKRYPEIGMNDLLEKDCQLLLLSSEPYPFKEKHVKELQQQLSNVKILLVDGEMFSWYGSRLLYAPPYFQQLLIEINGNKLHL